MDILNCFASFEKPCSIISRIASSFVFDGIWREGQHQRYGKTRPNPAVSKNPYTVSLSLISLVMDI